MALFRFAFRKSNADKNVFHEKSQNAKRRLYFVIKMHYEFYKILLSGFRDQRTKVQLVFALFEARTELLPFVSKLNLIVTTYQLM